MPKVVRFGVSLEKALLPRLDDVVRERNYASRSQAIADFVRRAMVKKQWEKGSVCVGTISLMFKPEDKDALSLIAQELRKNTDIVLSTQQLLIEGGKMFSVTAVKGCPSRLQALADALRGLKGVKYGSFSITASL